MPRESKANRKSRAGRILAELHRLYPDADCSLDHRGPLQLLVATILSAQCTDERVNKVTPGLFKQFPDAEAFAEADLPAIEKAIKSTGFYRNKAKSIRAACRDIVEKHGGRVPDTLEELTELAGVGRKTANVVLGVAYGKAVGVVVDTHVGRLSQRMKLTAHKDPVKIEKDLMECIEQTEWIFVSHAMILHGRQVCSARKPDCSACTLADKDLCPAAYSFPHNKGEKQS